MSKLILEFNTDEDRQVNINAAVRSGDLALCIYEIQERIRTEWEKCDDDSPMDKLIKDVSYIVENRIGNIDDYTE